ncbi:MAG: aminopeptidase [Chloroflexi bacterium]|nr:aminopeptidase [Chloroflexota bacterium]
MKFANRLSPALAHMCAGALTRKFVQPKPGEQVMILADSESDADFVHALAATMTSHGAEPTVVIIPPTFMEDGDRPLTRIALEALKATDIYIAFAATTSLAVHSEEITEATLGRTRQKNMRMLLIGGRYNSGLYGNAWQYMLEALNHDYEKVAEWCRKFCGHINGKKKIRVTSKEGSDFTASLEGITYRPECGFAREPGEIGGVPGGEVWGGPAEFTCEGVIAIDGPIAYVAHKPKLSQPVLVTMKKGRAVDIKGGEEADALKRWMDKYENADVLAELSLATNPFLKPTGEVNIIDKRVLGTMHVAFGENKFQIWPRGTVWSPVHADMVLLKPSCWVDDVQLLDNGVPVV